MRAKRRSSIVELLERRALLTAIVVNSVVDSLFPQGSGEISLRNAVALANSSTSPTTITFDPTAFATAQTIPVTMGVLELSNSSDSITITGPAAGVTLDGNNQAGGFLIDGPTTANISGFTITKSDSGGIVNHGTLSLTSDSISDNTTSNYGGGIENDGGDITLEDVILSGNATSFAGGGGGIYSVAGGATLTNVTISSNTGAGFYNDSNATATLEDVTLSSNTRSGFNNLGNATLTNVTVASNASAEFGGGGIYNEATYGGVLNLNDSTVFGNTASNPVGVAFGGGIYNSGDAASAVTVANSIIAGNSCPGSGPDVSGLFNSLGYNLIGQTDGSTGWNAADFTGTTASPLNPKLGSLANNGGFTRTMLPLRSSPAIDHGSNALIPAGITTDQRGLPRIVNGTVDIGAVELPAALASTTTLQTSSHSISVGDSVTLTATVAPASAGGATPTGTVQFLSGAISLGSATLSGGVAALSTTQLPVGSDSVTAVYGGDSTYGVSASALSMVNVASLAGASITTIATSADFLTLNESVTLTAHVAAATAGGVTPTGTMNFVENGSTALGSATLSGGIATLTTTALALGNDSVVASYSGDANYSLSSSSALSETVEHAAAPASITTLTTSAPSITEGDYVTLSATVTAVVAGGNVPSGMVTFFDGSMSLGTVAIQGDGTASLMTSALPVGYNFVSANFGGSVSFAASASSLVTVDVGVTSMVGLVASTMSDTAGAAVTFTATVSGSVSGGPTPTGTITFSQNGTTLGTAAVQSDGIATLTSSVLPLGSDAVTAAYSGDTEYLGSTSPAVTETISADPSTATPSLNRIVLPTTVVGGQPLHGKFPIVIANSGGKLVGRFTVDLYVSLNATLDSNAVPLVSIGRNLNLGADRVTTISARIPALPSTLASGTYYILSEVIDPTGALSVATSTKTVQVQAPVISLAASVGSVSLATLTVGKSASVLVTLTNTGNIPASGPMILTLAPSADGATALAGQPLTTLRQHLRLKPGQSRRFKVHYRVPAALASGKYLPFVAITLDGISISAAGVSSFTVG